MSENDAQNEVLEGRYQLQQKLGQNASRQTWLAVDLAAQPPEKVVVKLLTLNPQMQWDECKLFEREAQVLKTLNHPRIPQYRNYFYLEHYVSSRFPWFGLVQSYIPGASLQDLLNQGKRFSQKQVEQIAIEVLTILVYLHELEPPLLHRDIKPSNLIWGDDSRVYLVDFGGVQNQAMRQGATFTVVGTYGYVPMEQFGGRTVPASDLYALGATLIHLLTGAAPADLPQRDSRIQFGDRLSLDLGFVNWIHKLTEPRVADRLNTARQALEAFEHRDTLSPPLTSRKPTGSQIQLKKASSQLEIKISRRGGKAIKAFFLVGAVSSFLPILVQFNLISLQSPHFVLFLGALSTVILPLLVAVLGETQLYFDRQQFRVRWQLFGFCYKRQQGKMTDLAPLLTEEASINSWTGLEAKGLTIRTTLGKAFTTNPLSKVERLWLIQEINDWLSLNQETISS